MSAKLLNLTKNKSKVLHPNITTHSPTHLLTRASDDPHHTRLHLSITFLIIQVPNQCFSLAMPVYDKCRI